MPQIFLLLMLLSSCGLFQKKPPQKTMPEAPVEQRFLFKDKIIHPECVMLLQDFPMNRRTQKNLEILFGTIPKFPRKAFVNLSQCQTQKTPIVIENEAIATYRPKGQGMAQYKVISNPSKDEFLIRYLWNGGGSGNFTGVQLVALMGENLKLLKEFPLGGDRCNGGIEILKKESGEIRLIKNLTPIDFLELSSIGRSLKLKAYEDLEASASSCYARLVYGLSKTKEGIAFKLLGTKTLDIGETNTDIETRHSLQGCFDVQFQKLRLRTKVELLQKKDLEDFAQTFKKACL